jgi:hypothetical protein
MREPMRRRSGLYVVLKTLHWTWGCQLTQFRNQTLAYPHEVQDPLPWDCHCMSLLFKVRALNSIYGMAWRANARA